MRRDVPAENERNSELYQWYGGRRRIGEGLGLGTPVTGLTSDFKYGIMTLSVGDGSLFLSDFRKETDRYANLSADKIKRGKWYTEKGGEPR